MSHLRNDGDERQESARLDLLTLVTRIGLSTLSTGAAISAFTLSVRTSTTGSPEVTRSPGARNQVLTVTWST
jgi:hypothetical protein